MRKWLGRIAKLGILSLSLLGAGMLSVSADVVEGTPGQTVSGDYAIIVNTSTTATQSTGTLIFDASGSGTDTVRASSASDPVGQDVVQTGTTYAAASIAGGGDYAPGTRKSIASPYNGTRTYVCIGAGEHCCVWMEEGLKSAYDAAGKTDLIAQDMAKTYDGQPYEMLNEMAGGQIPWGKLSIMLETISSASGVYKYNPEITAIHINTPAASDYEPGTMGSRNGLLVHEGQHALFRLMAKSDVYQPYTWLNEGISVAAMDYLWGGTDSNGWMDSIAGNTNIRNGSPLIYKNYRNSTAQDYGMPYLFVRYLVAQAAGSYEPMQLFPKFYTVTADCSPDVYLKKVTGKEFGDLLTGFYTAIIAQESSGQYGFAGDATVRQKVNNYPLYMGASGQAHSLEPTAAIMIHLANGSFKVPTDGGSGIRYRIVSGGRSVSVPAGGDGSSGNPYRIDDFSDLALIGNKPGAHYILTENIEAKGQNLTVTYFSGVLDGGGHSISGLKMPLIGRNAGTIQNLTIEAAFDGTLTGTQGVFAQVNTGLIKDCMATGTIKATMTRAQSKYAYSTFGVFVGENEVAGRIVRCETRAAVTLSAPASDCWIGGIAGIQIGTVKNSLSGGSITVNVNRSSDGGTVYVGGLAGKLESMGMGGLLSCCIHTGSITVNGGSSSVGQLCGLADRSVVNSGLSAHLVQCRAKAENGAAVGSTNAVNAQIPADTDANVLLTEDQLKQQDSYSGWEFGSDWKMGDQGPERFTSNDIDTLGTMNTPVSCYVGEQIYSWGYLVINEKRGAVITDDMVSGFDSSTPGVKTVTVRYLGQTATFSVTVKAPGMITSFVLADSAQKAVKTTYSVGQYFNPSGLYFIATIDGTSNHMLYSGFTYEKRPLTAADKSVTVTYYGQSVVIPITVTGKAPDKLTVASNPSRTLFAEGQKLDLSGLRMSLVYNNGEATPVFGADQLGTYGIRVVIKKAGSSTYTEIKPDQVLTSADNGANIFVCATNAMPNNPAAVSAGLGKLTIQSKIQLLETEVHMVQGRKNQWETIPVSGGSGSYSAVLVSGRLPDGVTNDVLPGSWQSCFSYRGTPTAVGTYALWYDLKDTGTLETIRVEITIHVHRTDEASIYKFNLLEQMNPGLAKDVVGIIGENTVTLRVPYGTDVSAMQIEIDFGSSMGSTLPSSCWSGSTHDFSSPVVFTVTAPDGITKKSYTIMVEFYDPANPPKEESGGTGSGSTGGGTGSGNSGGSTQSNTGTQNGGSTGSGGTNSGSAQGNTGAQGGGSAQSGNAGAAGSKPDTQSSGSVQGNTGAQSGSTQNGSTGTTGNKPGTQSSGGTGSSAGSGGSMQGNTGTQNSGGMQGNTGEQNNAAVQGNTGAQNSGSAQSDSVGTTGGSTTAQSNGSTQGNTGTQNNTDAQGNTGAQGSAAAGGIPASEGGLVQEETGANVENGVAGDVTLGALVEQSGASYRVTSCGAETGTVELYSMGTEKRSSLKVAETVQIDGRTYKVTAIAAKAFRNNRSLKQVTIGGNVVSIGNQAFSGCTSLRKVVIGKSVQTIGARAFGGCRNLKKIIVRSQVLKKVKAGAVKGIPAKAVIRVPKKKKAAYGKLFRRNVS